jgi:hypothetical protein
MTTRVALVAGTAAAASILVRATLESLGTAGVPNLYRYQWQVLEAVTPLLFGAIIALVLWAIRAGLFDSNWSVGVASLGAWAFAGWYLTAIERPLEYVVRQESWAHVQVLRPDDPSVVGLSVRAVLLLGLGAAAALGALLGQRSGRGA